MSKIGDLFYEVVYNINDTGLKRVDNTTEKVGKQFKKTGKEADDLGKKVKKVGQGAGKGKDDFKGLGEEVENTGEKIKKVKGHYGDLKSFIGDMTTGLSFGAGLSIVGNTIKDSIGEYAEYDDSLRKTGAKISATNEQMLELSKSTREVAREYNANPLTVSDAQEFLALAGYSFEQIQQASPLIIQAQKATGESMQLVSDIATDTASAYGYMADELDYVTDRMVLTTSKFNTDFAQMGEAMKYVAPIAKQARLEFSDLNAYIGVLANSGTKGSSAGTALRQIFLKLQSPTQLATRLLKKYNIQLYDTKGNFVGVNESMLRMEKGLKRATEKEKAFFYQQMFGSESMSALKIILDTGVESIIKFGDEIDLATGKTKEMANFMEQGLGGSFRKIENRLADLKLEIGETFELPAKYGLELGSGILDNARIEVEKNNKIGYITTGALDLYKDLVGTGFKIGKKGSDLFFDYAGFGILRPIKNGVSNYLEERGKKVETDLKFNDDNLLTPKPFPKPFEQIGYKLGESFSENTLKEKFSAILNQEQPINNLPYNFNITLQIGDTGKSIIDENTNNLAEFFKSNEAKTELESFFNSFLRRSFKKVRTNY